MCVDSLKHHKIFLKIHVLQLFLQTRYKEASKKDHQSGGFTTLAVTRETAHSKEVGKMTSAVSLNTQFSPLYYNKSHL